MKKKTSHTLEIKNLHATVDGKKILKGLTLTVRSGEIHAIMGPNGSGKSTLCYVLMGHPKYTVTSGTITLDGKNIQQLTADKRAKLGLFLGFQYPQEIPGITLSNFLRVSLNKIQEAKNKEKKHIDVLSFNKILEKKMKYLEMPTEFKTRSVNEGSSGGEKKRAEIMQLMTLEPKIAILDETDSGLDVDALKIVSKGINQSHKETQNGLLLITHYQRLLDYVKPDFVHVMKNGKIILSGNKKLAKKIEKEGYQEKS